MTGWRLGMSLAPQPLVDAITKLQSQSTSNPTSIAQYAALAAMRGPMDGVHTMLAEYARRRERIVAGLRAIPGVTCTAPAGRVLCVPEYFGALQRRDAERHGRRRGSCSSASTSPSFPATLSARPDISHFLCHVDGPHRRRAAANSAFLRQNEVNPGWRVRHERLSRASGARLQSAALGRALARALFPGKIGPRRADRRGLDDGQRMPLCRRPFRGENPWRSLARKCRRNGPGRARTRAPHFPCS